MVKSLLIRSGMQSLNILEKHYSILLQIKLNESWLQKKEYTLERSVFTASVSASVSVATIKNRYGPMRTLIQTKSCETGIKIYGAYSSLVTMVFGPYFVSFLQIDCKERAISIMYFITRLGESGC